MRVRNRNTRLRLGSISSGTLKMDDLIPALFDAANSIQMGGKDRVYVRHMKWDWESPKGSKGKWLDNDIYASLILVLENYLPEFCYIGSHPGDGADIGVWPDEDALPLHGPATDEIGKGDCLPSASVIKQNYWLWINDHGNCTLYRKIGMGRGKSWKECWSVV